MSSLFRQQLERYLGELEVHAGSVLDVGGAQLPVRDRVKKWDVLDYVILDLEVPHVMKEKPSIVCDINYDGACADFVNDFDVVFCLEVMEYVHDPVAAIDNIKSMMRNDGILYISFPFIYPVHEPRNEDCLRYTVWGARKLLRNAGFVIEEIEHRFATQGKKDLLAFFSKEGMRAAKDFPYHDAVGCIIKAKA